MPVEFLQLLTGSSASITVYKTAKDFISKKPKILQNLTKNRQKIAILGAGGVGKTSISLTLADKKNEISFEYQSSPNVEKEKFSNCILLVQAGQERRVEKHWEQFQTELNNGAIQGCINVVAYGFHSTEQSSKAEFDFYSSGMSHQAFIQHYTDLHQRREIQLLKELKHSLKGFKKELWILTLVNKQDLWWSQQDEVRKFYTEGSYNNIIEELRGKIGDNNFNHEYISMSPIIHNFKIGSEILQPNEKGYDQLLQRMNESKVLETINGLIKN